MTVLETRAVCLQCVDTHNAISPFSTRISGAIDFEIMSHTVYGDESGPSLYVGGCMHGDELNGAAAALQLLQVIQAQDLRGTVVLVPIQSPLAFNFRERLNPFDPIDPDWVYPGRNTGTYSQVLKHTLVALASGADCVIDLHSAGRGGANAPMVYCPPETGNGSGHRSLNLSQQFGGDIIIFGQSERDYEWPVEFTLPFVAAREGRAGIYAEAGTGGAGIPDSEFVRFFVNGVVNVMRAMGMISGVVLENGPKLVINPTRPQHHIVCPVSGIVLPAVSVGDRVQVGDCIAVIWNSIGKSQEIIAPSAGMVRFLNMFGSCAEGDRLVTLSPLVQECEGSAGL